VIPIRLGLGAAAVTFLAFDDPRSRLAHGEVDPLPLPADAVAAPWWRQAFAAMLPSTVGVSILAAIALASTRRWRLCSAASAPVWVSRRC
jgi:hypothetical protein